MKETLKEHAYNYIKKKIINCEYQPGMFLNEDMLKEEVQASRTPIRDAISRLEQENLVKILPKKGILVSELSIREIQSIYESRLLIEPYTLLNYGNRVPEDQYMQFLKIFSDTDVSELDSNQMYDEDSRFHHTLVEASENNYLIIMYNQISSQNRRLRILSGVKSEDRLIATQNEHIRIIQSCLQQDWTLATDYMKEHLINSRKASFDVALKNYDLNL